MDKIYSLISNPVFDEISNVSLLFESALREEIENQNRNSHAFSKFLVEHEWKNGDPLESLPYLPVGAFKHQSLLTQVTEESRGMKLRSSGTSGLASSIFIDQETSRRQKLSVRLTLEDFFGSDRIPALVFDSDPRGSDSVGARQAAIMGYIRNASEVRYLIDEKSGLFTPSSSWNELITNPPTDPVFVVGFTFVLWKFLSDQLGSGGICLPKGSKVIHIGGWKKLESEKISNKDFSDLVSNYLGVEQEDIHDIYGFTELMGVSFIECSYGNKHVPKWVRASSLNLLTLEKQESHQQGLLAFQSPLAHSYLGLSIVTDDMGFVEEGSVKCLCGRPGQTIRVTGRRSKAEIRGCGDILGSTKFEQTQGALKTNSISGLFPSRSNLTLEDFQVAVTRVRIAGEELKSFNLGEKLEVIEALREEWKKLADADKSGNLRKNGVGFLVEWSSPDRLRKLLDSFLPGGRGALDGWVAWNQSSGSRIRSVPRGLMTQWVSGNVPALGMFPIIYSWITNNSNLSRLSTKAFELTLELLHPLKALALGSDAARALLEATLAVTFDHSNQPANQVMSRAADTIIAWGGESAIESISSLPTKREVKPLFFGPRTSYAVVFESAIDSDSRLGVIARRLVADSTVFEQAACASPHTVFVVSRNPETSEKLAQAISNQFEKEGNLASAEPIDNDLLTEIELYRKRRLLDSKVLAVSGYATVVMPAETLSLPEPVFGRTLHVVRIDSLEEAKKFTSPYLQSVSIAGNTNETEALAEMLVGTGVKRFPTVGKITNFENPWDGEDIISALVRTSTQGGP
jgi:hypothetical protein